MSAEYSVRSTSAGLKALAPYAITVVAALGIGYAADRLAPALIGSAVLLLLGLRAARRAAVLLRVDETGIMLTFPGRANVGTAVVEHRCSEWATVHRVLLDSRRPAVHVVLTADAPIPEWMTARITDPDDPEAGVRFGRTVPGLDVARCAEAARTASGGVEVRFQTLT